MPFPFIPTLQIYSNTSRKTIEKRIIEKGSDLMEKSLRRMEITNGPQDHEGTFQTRSGSAGTLPTHKTENNDVATRPDRKLETENGFYH
jgi:hypothetical protein